MREYVGRNRFIAPSSNGGLPAMSGKRRNKAIAPYALRDIPPQTKCQSCQQVALWPRSYSIGITCLLSDYAETIAERIAAKRDGRASAAFESLLTFRASVQRVDQDNLKIVDMEIDVNWSPVSLISTNVVRPLRRVGSCSLLDQADLGVATFENDVRRDWSSNFDKTQCITIKS